MCGSQQFGGFVGAGSDPGVALVSPSTFPRGLHPCRRGLQTCSVRSVGYS